MLTDEFSHSPLKSCPTVVSERKTNNKEWEEMKQRSQHFVFHQP